VIEELLEFERELWARANDSAFYSERLTNDAVLVFPAPFGLLDRDQTLEAVSGSAGWREVDLQDYRLVELTERSAAAAYRADAIGADGSPYSAFCSSAYVRGDVGWQLALHQQTPIGGDDT
jgi:Domain of unknown function (DUF4440)